MAPIIYYSSILANLQARLALLRARNLPTAEVEGLIDEVEGLVEQEEAWSDDEEDEPYDGEDYWSDDGRADDGEDERAERVDDDDW